METKGWGDPKKVEYEVSANLSRRCVKVEFTNTVYFELTTEQAKILCTEIMEAAKAIDEN